jgi:hypothetical protein
MTTNRVTVQEWINFLRKNADQYPLSFGNHKDVANSLREELTRNSQLLSDIGSSEEELKKLLTRGSQAGCLAILNDIRRKGGPKHLSFRKDLIELLREIVAEDQLSLADIDTSEDELGQLEK